MDGTEIVNGWGVWGVVSFLAFAGGFGIWFGSWQRTTRFLPWNKRYNARHPRFLHYTLVAQRIGFWVMVGGVANFLAAMVLEAVLS